MENENKNKNNKKKKVSRQSWKPNSFFAICYGAWKAIYSGLKIAAGAVLTVLIIAAVCVLVFVGVLADYLEGEILPQAGVQLDGFDLDQKSYVYYLDSKGDIQLLQELHADVESEWASYEEIPKDLINATVSIEDHRFFEHQGVDWFTTLKACINMFVGSGDQFGGSSITQQLIKNLLLTMDESADDVTVQRKVLEIFRATEFEKRYDKSVVLEWYLNVIYLGNRCSGVKAAAEKYFGKELEDLTPAECACIISITNNPSLYNPYRDALDSNGLTGAEENENRRIDCLWLMRNYGYLTEEEYQEALAQELVFKDGIDFENRYSDCMVEDCGYHGWNSTFKEENGIYYCPECGNEVEITDDASEEVYSWFVDTVVEDLAMRMVEEAGLEWNKDTRKTYMALISRGGYHIYSTLNMDVQNAVDAIYKNLDEIPTTASLQQLQSAIVIIDNRTGDIVAMSGGVGEDKGHDDYNRATDAKLQPGSSAKPLTVYGPAFELGVINPATIVKDLPYEFKYNDETDPEKPTGWPRNSNKKYNYSNSIFEGVTSSTNAIAINTLATMGVDYSFHFAKEKFGLEYLTDHYVSSNGTVFSDVNLSPLGLGAPTIGVTVRQMATAYATFANKGVIRDARTYTKVYNSEGEVVLNNEQSSEQILSEKTVNYMNYCLDNVVNSGTGKSADIKGQNVSGKTGTTTSGKDRWFCGFTGYYTAAIWCGYDQPEVMTVTGSNTNNPACQLFKKVMTPVHEGLEAVDMYDDSEFISVAVCLDSGKLATSACAADIRGSRIYYGQCCEEDIPTQTCDQHISLNYCVDGVANEYCLQFKQAGKITLRKTSLLKMTQQELDTLIASGKTGLVKEYLRNDYIYLVDELGNPGHFTGLDGTLNLLVPAPCHQCTVHTAENWQAYLDSLKPVIPDPVVPAPTDPAPVVPEEPVIPVA